MKNSGFVIVAGLLAIAVMCLGNSSESDRAMTLNAGCVNQNEVRDGAGPLVRGTTRPRGSSPVVQLTEPLYREGGKPIGDQMEKPVQRHPTGPGELAAASAREGNVPLVAGKQKKQKNLRRFLFLQFMISKS